MHLELPSKALQTRGGALDQILDAAFDAAVILDQNGLIIHNTHGSARLIGRTQAEVVGLHITQIDPVSPFEKALRTGQAEHNLLTVINGRKCLCSIYPVFSGGQMVGIIAVMLFQGLANLKKIIASLNDGMAADSHEVYNAVARIDSNYTFEDFIGESPAIQHLLHHCRSVAQKKVHPILILGETGTGKEILASAFHSQSMDAHFTPFIKINCTAIPNDLLESELFGHEKGAFTGAVAAKKGKFELAAGGMILLDEIGDMDLRLQSKLLRVLEEGEYERIGGTKVLPLNARVIASTNQELRESCRKGRFRPDLYYRLSNVEIRIPPLRARREDIPLLIDHLIAKAGLSMTLSPGAIEVLMQYHWPGNVRELRNVLNWLSILNSDRAITPEEVRQALSDKLEETWDLPAMPPPASAERAATLQALERCQQNVTAAAKLLGISRTALYARMRKHQIQRKEAHT